MLISNSFTMGESLCINIRVVSAKNLIKRSLLKTPDPFVQIKTDCDSYFTQTNKKTLNPDWKENFESRLSSSTLEIFIWDNRLYSKKRSSAFLGFLELTVDALDCGVRTLKLQRYKSFPNKSVRGTCTLEISKCETINTNIPDSSSVPFISAVLHNNGSHSNITQMASSSHRLVRHKDRSKSTSDAVAPGMSTNYFIRPDTLLPIGFERRVSEGGKVFYIDMVQGSVQWYHPGIPKYLRRAAATDLSCCLGPLPSGWDTLTSESGRQYFIDHNARTTQYTDPRLLAALVAPDGLIAVVDRLRAAGIVVKDQQGCTGTASANMTAGHVIGRMERSRSDRRKTSASGRVSNPIGGGGGFIPVNDEDPRAGPLSSVATVPVATVPGPSASVVGEAISRQRTPNTNFYLSPEPAVGGEEPNGVGSDEPGGTGSDQEAANQSDECQQEVAPLSFQRRRISRPTSDYVLANKNAIETKLKNLRLQLKTQMQRKLCIIETSRDNILDHSYMTVRKLRNTEMHRRLVIKFTDEEGLDYGGLAREWLYLLSETLFSCRHGLFEASPATDGSLLRISALSIINENHLRYFHFIGRIIGIAIFHGYYVDADFCRTFYKRILGQKPCLEDFKYFDMGIYKSLQWILNNSIDEADLGLTFSVEQEMFGQLKQVDLCSNGRNIPVTDHLKHDYVRRYIEYQLGEKSQEQYSEIRRGIFDVLPPNIFDNINEDELEVLLAGVSAIDIDDWRRHTRLKHCMETDPPIQWFWLAVHSYSEQQRVKLLQFVTGSSRIPLVGFEGLRGSYGSDEPKLFTIKLVRTATPTSLPKAHTCFNRLDLPPYTSYQNLREKLTCAIEETCGFAVM